MKKTYLFIFACFSCLNLSSCSFSKCEVTAEIFVKSKSKIPRLIEDIYVDVLDKNGVPRKQSVFAYSDVSEIMMIQSEPVIQRVIDKLKLENAKGHPLKTTRFKKNLQATYKEKDNVLYLSYKDSNLILAEEIVNTLLEIYIEESIASNIPSFTVFPDVSIPKVNEEVKSPHIPNKKEQDEIIATYWKGIEEMNKDIPQEIKLDKYQSHSMRIIKMADSSCSKN